MYISSCQPDYFTAKALHASGEGIKSQKKSIAVSFSKMNLLFQWQLEESIPSVSALQEVNGDFYKNPPGIKTFPDHFKT